MAVPRSKSYGSCNSRERCYIIGVREDIFKQDLLDQMVAFVKFECAAVHHRVSIETCHLPASDGKSLEMRSDNGFSDRVFNDLRSQGWDLCGEVIDELHVPKAAKARVEHQVLHDLQHRFQHDVRRDFGPPDRF